MKPSHHAEPVPAAPTRYAPSVPMSVYRELAAELRANKAVIDSLNSRNQQLLGQNQRLKQEIHSVVQATLTLGQFAGVARPAAKDGFPSAMAEPFPRAIAPDTLARLVRAQGEARKVIADEPPASADSDYASTEAYQQLYQQPAHHAQAEQIREQQARAQARAVQIHEQAQAQAQAQAREQAKLQAREQAREKARADKAAHSKVQAAQVNPQKAANAAARHRVPRPIQTAPAQVKSPDKAPVSKRQRAKAAVQPGQRFDMMPTAATPLPKLFTEQAGDYRNKALESTEEKEIGGIWLALSIILIIVTAFGAGFLIMKPLLNDR